jgi:cytoskeletal protein RodZ
MSLEMATDPTFDPNIPIEVGRLLKVERIKQNLSMEDMCRKMGARVKQIQAIEEGNTAHFQKNMQPFMWFVRLYAKKLGIDLPDLSPTSGEGTKQADLSALEELPEFLKKPTIFK